MSETAAITHFLKALPVAKSVTLSHSSFDTFEAIHSSPFARKPACHHFSKCLSSTLWYGMPKCLDTRSSHNM